MRIFILWFVFFYGFGTSHAQLRLELYPSEHFLVHQMLLGDSSIKVWNIQFQGTHDARGVFYNSDDSLLPISQGILLTTGLAQSAIGPNREEGFTTANHTKGDADLHFLAKHKTYDAYSLTFEFEPSNNLIRFNYVFASEEYPEYVGSPFNDVFGFFLKDLETGEITNLAVIPNTKIPITINNINPILHAKFYQPNPPRPSATHTQLEYDGMTKLLIAYSEVTPGRKYEIKLAIADVGDPNYDSGVFIEGQSFVSQDKEVFFENNQSYFADFMEPSSPNIKPLSKNKKPVLKINVPNTPYETRTNNSTVIDSKEISDSIIVYFNFDKSELTKTKQNELKQKLNQIDTKPIKVHLAGHTDQLGTQSYNQILSEKRALYISNWLKAEFQIQYQQISGHSFHQLAKPQTTFKARKKNRRVVIYIYSK